MTATTKEYVNQHCMIGSGNAEYVPCAFEGAHGHDAVLVLEYIRNAGSGDMYLTFMLPMPTNRGGLKLYITGIKVAIVDADANDYLNNVKVIKIRSSSNIAILNDASNTTSPGDYTNDFSNKDVSAYDIVKVDLHIVCTDAQQFEIGDVSLKCFYDN